MQVLKWINIALRGLMELGIVAGLGYWGYHSGYSQGWRLALAVGAPLLGFGFWGAVDFRQFGKLAEPVRLIQELLISGIAAWALYISGAYRMAWALATLSVAHHTLVYALGERLLKRK